MIEKLKDFKDTLSERIKSPFIGSFMIAWAVIHWRIFVFFIYTEEKLSIKQRIAEIESYLKTQTFHSLVEYPVLITLLVLISYSLLNAIGLIIKLLYDNWASPYIQKLLYNKNIIEKDKYEKLKREYSNIKNSYDSEKEKFISTDKDLREINVQFEAFRKNGLEGNFLTSITEVFDRDSQWENSYTFNNQQTGQEFFTCDPDGFLLTDGDRIGIENIRTFLNGKILMFDKKIDLTYKSNYLIRDANGDYHGVENDNVAIVYKKNISPHIIVESAKYGANDTFKNVKKEVANKVAKNLEITASNDAFGDPIPGTAKKLEIVYLTKGKRKVVEINEGETIKIVQ